MTAPKEYHFDKLLTLDDYAALSARATELDEDLAQLAEDTKLVKEQQRGVVETLKRGTQPTQEVAIKEVGDKVVRFLHPQTGEILGTRPTVPADMQGDLGV